MLCDSRSGAPFVPPSPIVPSALCVFLMGISVRRMECNHIVVLKGSIYNTEICVRWLDLFDFGWLGFGFVLGCFFLVGWLVGFGVFWFFAFLLYLRFLYFYSVLSSIIIMFPQLLFSRKLAALAVTSFLVSPHPA